MDTHYPESVEDFNDLDDDENEEHTRVQQELAEQAMKIEKEFWNIDFNWLTFIFIYLFMYKLYIPSLYRYSIQNCRH